MIGIPVYRERDWLPKTLASLADQDTTAFEVWICVNQPAEFLHDPARATITQENLDTLAWLERERTHFPFPLRILDAVRPPHAGQDSGVGWARRFLFERMIAEGGDETICISLDGDTTSDGDYVSKVREAFERYPNAAGLAAPYRHPLPHDPRHALHLLRYEIYMRYYQLSLWRIGSPYAFLAIGSAMAFRGRDYRRARGFPLRKAGEDFYFMQQLRKTGPIIRWLDSRVYPAARFSDRVPFGTGPLMGQPDLNLQENRFPFYAQQAFDQLHATFTAFERFHHEPVALPIHDFIQARMNGYHAFENMRRNFSQTHRFVKACHEKLDGLRTLQFLRFYHEHHPGTSHGQDNLDNLLDKLGKPRLGLRFTEENIEVLEEVRNLLAGYEAENQQRFMAGWDHKARW